MPDDQAPAEGGDSGAGTSLLYSLAIFYLLVGVFTVILAWVVPGVIISASVAFTLLGSIVIVASIVQVTYTAELSSSLCGTCPPPSKT